MTYNDEFYMKQAIEMAEHAIGAVSPNPMVGALLVYNDEIIGQGFHEKYGESHAEVNCFDSVKDEKKYLISESTLYVTLEPCAHFGKTPPCADRIINEHVKRVVIATSDPFSLVNGKGTQRVMKAGIEVETGILETEARFQNRRFFCFHEKKRPYIILKWAQTSDCFMAADSNSRLMITGDKTNHLVHNWRSEEDAILIGTDTALLDDPLLTNRLASGKDPLRILLDLNLRLPNNLRMFHDNKPIVIMNYFRDDVDGDIKYKKVSKNDNLRQMVFSLHNDGIQSVLVEGGAKLLGSFIQEDIWDEARVITNKGLTIGNGLKAPIIPPRFKVEKECLLSNELIQYIYHSS